MFETYQCAVVCFQATKKENIDLAFIRKFCPPRFDGFAFNPSVGRSGGILIVWCTSQFQGEIASQNDFALSVNMQPTKCGKYWTLTNIYAPCQDDGKTKFLDWLNDIQIQDDVF